MSQEQRPNGVGYVPRLLLSLVVVALYVVACVCPAIEFVEVPRDPNRVRDFGQIEIGRDPTLGVHTGYAALLFGASPPWTLPWSANVLLLLSLVLLLLKQSKLALGFGVAATLVGLTTWLHIQTQDRLLVGYYLWQASMLVLVLGTWAIWSRLARPTK